MSSGVCRSCASNLSEERAALEAHRQLIVCRVGVTSRVAGVIARLLSCEQLLYLHGSQLVHQLFLEVPPHGSLPVINLLHLRMGGESERATASYESKRLCLKQALIITTDRV